MIIQCEKCQTKFRLDDSRVTDKGVKVRCTKCKQVFTVQKEQPETESFEPEGAWTDPFPSAALDETPSTFPEDQHLAVESFRDAPQGQDFSGDDLTSGEAMQPHPEEPKPIQEIQFTPPVETQDKVADDDITRPFPEAVPAGDQEELPPLLIASRRKQSSYFGGLIAVIALLVILILGYLGYSLFAPPKETAVPESGKIGIRSVKAAFIDNDGAGELLVISGEALNEYPNPRAALQVKVTVFDAAGKSIATKTAYGGNPLTEEQQESLPLDKIEAAMANQFGDSLANMEVAPGKAIPFVVVLANLPGGAKDFGVQPAGSTVATGKQ